MGLSKSPRMRTDTSRTGTNRDSSASPEAGGAVRSDLQRRGDRRNLPSFNCTSKSPVATCRKVCGTPRQNSETRRRLRPTSASSASPGAAPDQSDLTNRCANRTSHYIDYVRSYPNRSESHPLSLCPHQDSNPSFGRGRPAPGRTRLRPRCRCRQRDRERLEVASQSQ